jgi:hypothetical protein
MANDRIPELIPFYGCQPFAPPPPKAKRCSRCGGNGTAPEGSRNYCEECASVAPEYEALLSGRKTRAIATQEPAKNRASARAAEMRAARKTSLARGDSVLTADERAELVAEGGDAARAWLDSIGQPAGAKVEERQKRKPKKEKPAWRRERRAG